MFGCLLPVNKREAASTKLHDTEEQLLQARKEHQRYMLEREADAKATAAAALHEKIRELADQKEALDRCWSAHHTTIML